MNNEQDKLQQLTRQQRAQLLERLRQRQGATPTVRYPASAAQQRLWFLDELGDHGAYNMACALSLDGAVDLPRLQRAVASLVQRHGALRTTFAQQDDTLVQLVHDSFSVPLPVTALDGGAEPAARLERLLRDEAGHRFDLRHGPLLRLHLFRLGPRHEVLSLVLHHIVADGWSLDILLRELALLYGGGVPARAAAPFGEYVRQAAAVPANAGELAYWTGQLGGTLPLLNLPLDHARPTVPAFRGATQTLLLDADMVARLRAGAAALGVTPYMLLLAGFKILLAKYSGQDDIVVGTPAMNRGAAQWQHTVGYFTNTLALRSGLRWQSSVTEFVAQVKATTLQALERQHVPFEAVLEALHAPRDLAHSPVFQAMFAYQATPLDSLRLGELQATPRAVGNGSAKFDLQLLAFEAGAQLRCEFEYSTDLFAAASIERLAAHYRQVLNAMLADPALPLAQLSLCTPEDRALLAQWNATGHAYPGPHLLHELVVAQARRTPDAHAVLFEDEALSYSALEQQSARLARRLRALGAGRDQPVAVLMRRSLHLPVALLAVLRAGAAYVPLDAGYPQPRLEYMLADSGAAIMLADADIPLPAAAGRLRVLHVPDGCAGGPEQAEAEPAALALPDSLAYLIYTSGSTGKPKGAMNTHQGVCNRLLWMQQAYRLGTSDRVLQKTPISFDVSVWELFWPLISGATLVMARPEGHKDSLYLRSAIERWGVTVLHFVPSMLKAWLADLPPGACSSLRDVICSGEALPTDVASAFLSKVPARLHNLYGPTEAAIDVTYWQCEAGNQAASTPIGRPIANTQIHIVDANLVPLPPGIPGELLIGGVGVGRGYLRQAELSAQKFIEHPRLPGRLYRSGDLARWTHDGVLEFLGRLDDQVKIRGFRIELGEIEAALKALPDVRDAVVVAAPVPAAAPRLVAYVVGAQCDEGRLAAQLSQSLPDYMVPQRYLHLSALPVGVNGKLDRKALPAPDWLALRSTYVAPDSHEELMLAQVWREVLGTPRIGIDDNYFALGGDSIRSLAVVARARQLGLQLELPLLFQFPTIRQLARYARGTEPPLPATAAFALAPEGVTREWPAGVEDVYPLSVLQAGLVLQTALHQGTALYHDIMQYRIAGRFDRTAFQAALDGVVRRHPVLRTAFDVAAQPEPLQLVYRDAELPLLVHDLRHEQSSAQEHRMAQDLEREKAWRFDWRQPPLMRVIVHVLDERSYQYTLSFHDVLLDGWSVNALNTELFQAYECLLLGRAAPAALPPEPRYREFIAAEQRALADARSAQFWDERLAGAEATLLPRRRRAEPGEMGGVCFQPVPLDASLSRRLDELASQEGVPLKSVLLAAHMKALSVLCNLQDVTSGLEHNGRLEQQQADAVLGLFLNTLPFRLRLARGSWQDLIRQVFQEEVALLPHRRFPMARMQQRRRAPLPFEVVFNYTHFHVAQQLSGLEVGQLLSRSAVLETEYPLRAEFNRGIGDGMLTLDLHYDGVQFPLEQVGQIAAVYHNVLLAMTAAPQESHTQRSLIAAQEREWLLHGMNDCVADYPLELTYQQLFERQAAATPDRIALRCAGRAVSYGQLNAQANRLAHWLNGQGVGPEVLVPILLEREDDFLVAILAVFKAGAAYVPLDPRHPPHRLWQVLQAVEAPVMLSHSRFAAALSEVSVQGLACDPVKGMLDQLSLEQGDGGNPPLRSGPDSLAYVIYTSGSTGAPKGAMVLQKGMINHLYAKVDALQVTADDVVAQTAPQCFDISVWQFLVALVHGGCTVVYPDAVALEPMRLLTDAARDGVTILETVPSLLRATTGHLALASPPPLVHMRWLLVTGEALPPDLCGDWLRYYPTIPLLNAYGPTECSDDVAHYPIHAALPEHTQITPIGRVIPNMQLYVLDADLHPVPLGTAGELYVGGVGVGRGYFRDAARTAAAFLVDPYHPAGRLYKTGDLVRYSAEGALEFLGRLDHQVKLRGFRIELGEVEAVLLQQAVVKECVVVAHEQKLVAYVVAASALDVQQLRRDVARLLPEYMVPALVIPLDRLPVNANGKLDRKQLPAPQVPDGRYVAPAGCEEQAMHRIWCEALQVGQVSVEDSFFEAGGHSLLLVQMHAQVQAQFGREIAMTAFFEYPTIRSFCAFLRRRDGAQPAQQELAGHVHGQQRRLAMRGRRRA